MSKYPALRQILLTSREIQFQELDFLLRFPITPNVTSPVDFLTNVLWGAIKSLSAMDEFKSVAGGTGE